MREKLSLTEQLAAAVASVQKMWACQARGCKNYTKGACWISLDEIHIQLLASDCATWADEIIRGNATKTVPPVKLMK